MPARATAVLDACVLVPGSLRSLLLRAASADLYTPRWSDNILNEVKRTFETGKVKGDGARLITWMRELFPDATVRDIDALVPRLTNDAKDRHVLAAAVRSQAEFIVTQNVRHFQGEDLAPHDIQALTPDQFLLELLDSNGSIFVDIIRDQAGVLNNPPMTPDEVLGKLAVHVPRFVQHIQSSQTTVNISKLRILPAGLAC